MVPSPPAPCQRIPAVRLGGPALLEVDRHPDDAVLDDGAGPDQVGLAVQDVAPVAGRVHEGVLEAADRGGHAVGAHRAAAGVLAQPDPAAPGLGDVVVPQGAGVAAPAVAPGGPAGPWPRSVTGPAWPGCATWPAPCDPRRGGRRWWRGRTRRWCVGRHWPARPSRAGR